MLKYRLISAAGLLTLLFTALFWKGNIGAIVFTLIASAMVAGAISEFFGMMEKVGFKGYKTLTTAVGVLMILSVALPAFLTEQAKVFTEFETILMFTFIILGFFRVFKSDDIKDNLLRHFISIGALMYLAWMLNFIAKVYFIGGTEMNGRYLVLFLILVTKCSDIGAYFTGKTCSQIPGRENHKIAPKLSPGKSWEGFFGGIALSVIMATCLVMFLGDKMTVGGVQVLGYPSAIFLGVCFATLGFFGDIAESVLKRSSGVKDSGSILPGMGGVMDVVDSLTLVAPLFYCYIQLAK